MSFLDKLFTSGQRHFISFRNARVNGDLVKHALDLHGRFKLKARGGSMFPVIRDGEVIEIIPIDPETIRVGDIVMTVFNNERYVIHRVVRFLKKECLIYTKGDSIDAVDPPAGSDEFLGIVNWYAHKGRMIRFRRGLIYKTAPVLAAFSLASFALTELIGTLLRLPEGNKEGPRKSLARIARIPGWILAKIIVEISYLRSKPLQGSDPDTDHSAGCSP